MTLQILVPLHTYPDGNSANIAAHVAVVARHLKADVHGLVLNATFPSASSIMGNMIINVDSMVREVTAKCHTKGAALVIAMQAALEPMGIKFRITHLDCSLGTIGAAAETYGRYHDLIVTGLSVNDVSMEATAETAVFGSGRPTLLVLQDASPSQFHHVMIAWDGSRVATRAVADAHEFLRLAKTVTIAVVTDEKALPEGNPATRLSEYLDLHGINTTVAMVQAKRRPIARALQEHALEIGADMMVMGAFGHSRMRDFVMGGATAGILRDLKLPVLLSH
jgi:nucleotide-binding universal stress UspA family protein